MPLSHSTLLKDNKQVYSVFFGVICLAHRGPYDQSTCPGFISVLCTLQPQLLAKPFNSAVTPRPFHTVHRARYLQFGLLAPYAIITQDTEKHALKQN